MAKFQGQFSLSPRLKELESERRRTLMWVILCTAVPIVADFACLRYWSFSRGSNAVFVNVAVFTVLVLIGFFYSLRMIENYKKKLRQNLLIPLINDIFPDADTTSGKSYHSIDSFFKSKLLLGEQKFSVSSFEENGITHIFHGDLGSVQYSDLEVKSGSGRHTVSRFDGMVAYYKAELSGLGGARFEAPRRDWRVFPWKNFFCALGVTCVILVFFETSIFGVLRISNVDQWIFRGMACVPLLLVVAIGFGTYLQRRKIESEVFQTRHGLWWANDTFKNGNRNLDVLSQPILDLYRKHKQVAVCSFTTWGLYISFPKMHDFMNISLWRSLTSGKQQRVWSQQLTVIQDVSEALFKILGNLGVRPAALEDEGLSLLAPSDEAAPDED